MAALGAPTPNGLTLQSTPAMHRLIPATAADAARLLAWRNDPVVRAASFDDRPIERADHVAWLERRLADPTVRLLIIEAEGAPVGQVRLDADAAGRTAEVSIGLAAEARGRGLAVPVLQDACAIAASELGADLVIARVKPGNAASLRAFAQAGFVETGRDTDQVVMERPARQAP